MLAQMVACLPLVQQVWGSILGRVVNHLPLRAFSRGARRAGSDGSMSASGSAGLGFDPRRDSKFSFENFQPRG